MNVVACLSFRLVSVSKKKNALVLTLGKTGEYIKPVSFFVCVRYKGLCKKRASSGPQINFYLILWPLCFTIDNKISNDKGTYPSGWLNDVIYSGCAE